MELYKEILINILKEEKVCVEFKRVSFNTQKIMLNECYILLEKIKTVIDNDSLSDFECIEKIVCLFEQAGINTGNRHNFG